MNFLWWKPFSDIYIYIFIYLNFQNHVNVQEGRSTKCLFPPVLNTQLCYNLLPAHVHLKCDMFPRQLGCVTKSPQDSQKKLHLVEATQKLEDCRQHGSHRAEKWSLHTCSTEQDMQNIHCAAWSDTAHLLSLSCGHSGYLHKVLATQKKTENSKRFVPSGPRCSHRPVSHRRNSLHLHSFLDFYRLLTCSLDDATLTTKGALQPLITQQNPPVISHLSRFHMIVCSRSNRILPQITTVKKQEIGRCWQHKKRAQKRACIIRD